MMMKWIFVLGFLTCCKTVYAADGNIEAGKNKSLTCAACHGPQGNSLVDMYPNLAGQHSRYLEKQLLAYRLASQTSGSEGRNNIIMNGMSANLTDQDIADLAAYYSSLDSESGETPVDVVEYAEALYRGGDVERGITACTACHGPQGNGLGLANFPDVSGQKAGYIKAQLEMFRSGTRANDHSEMMRKVAIKLTDKDIDALSKYLRGLY